MSSWNRPPKPPMPAENTARSLVPCNVLLHKTQLPCSLPLRQRLLPCSCSEKLFFIIIIPSVWGLMSLCGGFFFAFADFPVEFILVHFRGNIRGVFSAETSGAISRIHSRLRVPQASLRFPRSDSRANLCLLCR